MNEKSSSRMKCIRISSLRPCTLVHYLLFWCFVVMDERHRRSSPDCRRLPRKRMKKKERRKSAQSLSSTSTPPAFLSHQAFFFLHFSYTERQRIQTYMSLQSNAVVCVVSNAHSKLFLFYLLIVHSHVAVVALSHTQLGFFLFFYFAEMVNTCFFYEDIQSFNAGFKFVYQLYFILSGTSFVCCWLFLSCHIWFLHGMVHSAAVVHIGGVSLCKEWFWYLLPSAVRVWHIYLGFAEL
jgi:hypothetical protein